MRFFENKKIWKKIVIMLLMVLLFQFGFATPVQAAGTDELEILVGPIISLVLALGDRNN